MRNARVSSAPIREKFGIQILNAVKEVLLLDKINGNAKWCNAIQKEMKALEKLNG